MIDMIYKTKNTRPAGQRLASWIQAIEAWRDVTYIEYFTERILLVEDSIGSATEVEAEFKMTLNQWGKIPMAYVPCRAVDIMLPYGAHADWRYDEDHPLFWMVCLHGTTEQKVVQEIRNYRTASSFPDKIRPEELIAALEKADPKYGDVLSLPYSEIKARIRSGRIGPDLGHPNRKSLDPVGLDMAKFILYTRLEDPVWEMIRGLHLKSEDEREVILGMVRIHDPRVLYEERTYVPYDDPT